MRSLIASPCLPARRRRRAAIARHDGAARDRSDATRYPVAPTRSREASRTPGCDLRAQASARGRRAPAGPGAQVVQGGGFRRADVRVLKRPERIREGTGGRRAGEPAGRRVRFANSRPTTSSGSRSSGAGSVLYGSDAIAGVVQISTREGAGRPRERCRRGRAHTDPSAGRGRERGGRRAGWSPGLAADDRASTTSTMPTATPC